MHRRPLQSFTRAAVVTAVTLFSASALLGQAPAGQKPAATTFTAPRTPWGHPDLQGVWDQTTGTPLERPAEYQGRKFLTDQEAAERERTRFSEFDQPGRAGGTGDYGSVWRDGSR